MRYKSIYLLSFFALATTALDAWPQKESDIAFDPSVQFGQLENGFRYAILPNAEPPGRVSLRLHIDAGSLNEDEDQRGLAHFLEHMVFNGSRSFPDASALIPKMQRLGIAFGAHANAYTSFDETVYMLDLPNQEAETLELAFTVMRDFADGALLEPAEIEKERGVILAELRSRDSVGLRLLEQRLEFLMPDFLASKRLPIGLESVIETAPPERIRAFYETFYTPRNMTLVVVGDIDAAEFAQRTEANFASMENPDAPQPSLDFGQLPTNFGLRAAVFTDEEVSADSLTLTQLEPYTFEPDRVAQRIEDLPLYVANSILSRRLEILAKEEGSPIKGGSASYSAWLNQLKSHSVSVSPDEDAWPEALKVLEQELRRALEYGFTKAELKEIRANILNAAEEAVRGAATRRSPGLASELLVAIHAGAVFSHPEEDLRILAMGLEQLTAEKTLTALRAAWDNPNRNLILTTKSAPKGTEATLIVAFEACAAIAVDPPDLGETAEFAYTDFGPAGTVQSRHQMEDLDFTQLVLSNGVRINLKQTDFEQNSIRLMARFGDGRLSQPFNQTGLEMVASAVMNAGGLGKHSEDELRRILAGRNVGYGFGIGADTFILSGRTTPADLPLQLQLMTAGLTDPGYRGESLRQFRQQVPAIRSQLRHTLDGAVAELNEWLSGGDGRFAKPDPDALANYEIDDVRAWIEPQLLNSYLELSLVGDFDPKTALPMILKTFGSLPERPAEKETLTAQRSLKPPTFPAEPTFRYDSKINKALAQVVWKGIAVPEDAIKPIRRLHVVASILRDRLRTTIREEMGASYSPRAGYSADPVFGQNWLTASSITQTAEIPKLHAAIKEIAEALGSEGASQDELDRALRPILGSLELSLRENGHWLNTILARSQEAPYVLDWARQRDDDYASIQLEEVNALAAQVLRPERAATVRIIAESEDVQDEPQE